MQSKDIKVGEEYFAESRNLRTDYGDERGRVRVVAKGRYRWYGTRFGSEEPPKDAIAGYVADERNGKPMVVVERVDGKPTSHMGDGMQAVIATRDVKSTWADRVKQRDASKTAEQRATAERTDFNTKLHARAEAIRACLAHHGVEYLAAKPDAGWGSTADLGRTQHKVKYTYTTEQMAELIHGLTGLKFDADAFPELPTEGLVE